MKKAILSLILLLAGVGAYAQPAFGTKVYRDSNGIVLLKGDDGSWVILQGTGAPTLTTYIGESVPNKALYFNLTTAGAYSYSNGTWTLSSAGAASSITPATTTVGASTNCFLYSDASSLLQCGAAFVADDSGTGNGVFTVRKTMSGASAFSNFMSITGTLPTTLSAQTEAVLWQFTTAGTSSQSIMGHEIILAAGYTGTSTTRTFYGLNQVAGTGGTAFAALDGNIGGTFHANVTAASFNTGAQGIANGGNSNAGVVGRAIATKNGATNIGGAFFALNAGTTPIQVGLFAGLRSTDPTFVSSGLQVDNGAVAAPIAVFQDNGTVVTQIRDGGTVAGKDAVAGTDTDTAGGALTIGGGTGTGTGKGGSLVLQTTPSTTTGTTSLTPYDRVTFAAKAVALTDAATILFTVNTLGAHKRSGGTLEFTVQASDGTNDQVATGRTYWGAVDTTAGAGGETCTNLVDGLTVSAAASGAASSGTLVITADATTGTDLCNFRITPAGSLTETTYNVYYWITKNLPDGAVSLP